MWLSLIQGDKSIFEICVNENECIYVCVWSF